MKTPTRHALVLRDGVEHIHRWAPACSCGSWVGPSAPPTDAGRSPARRPEGCIVTVLALVLGVIGAVLFIVGFMRFVNHAVADRIDRERRRR